MSKRPFLVRVAFSVFLLFTIFTCVCAAQFKVSDNFNRPDGATGLSWSNWGAGAQISSNQLETFGQTSVAGGIARNLDVTFPVSFAFNFSTNAPTDGGWQIAFNAATADGGLLANDTAEIRLLQFRGSGGICTEFQTASGPMDHCGNPKTGQRDFTAIARISGTINPDFSSTVTIRYNDGQMPASVTIKSPAPVGAIQSPLGSIFFFGNSNATFGPHFFDNISLTLK